MTVARSGFVACLALLASTSVAFATVTPPVPLRTPLPFVPDEIAGTGLAPEAKVAVTIDERGAVSAVEVVSISPSTEFDDAIRRKVIETISRYRYAPQLRDGAPEATVLQWRIAFPPRSAAVSEAPSDSTRTFQFSPLLGSDAESRRSAILALPERKRLELLRRQVEVARGLLEPARARSAESPRFVVHSDADSPEAAAQIAQNLEAIYNTLASRFLPGIELLPERYRIQVVAYRDQQAYAQLVQQMPIFEWSAGVYSPAGLIAFHLQQPSNDAVMSLLLHETTHAFMDRHVVRRGSALPRWMGEGFADYVGNSQIKKGQLVPGKTTRGKYELWRGMVARIETSGAQQLDAAKRALRTGRGLSVERLLEASPETFYGDDRELYYASAWLLVHFLRDGKPEWAETRFPRALIYLAEGYPASAVVRDLYGDPARLDAEFRAYVSRF